MKALRRLWARLRNVSTRRTSDRRLREEVEEHLAFQTDEYIRAGFAPEVARRMAVLKFGSVESTREG